MKTLLLILALSSPVIAQDGTTLGAGGCGPNDIKFDVTTIKNHPIAQPEAGKALVYVIEDETREVCIGCGSTVRVGLDGKWVGANKSSSYFSFPVESGERQLCAGWQTGLKLPYSKLAVATTLIVEPGKSYFYQIAVHFGVNDPDHKGPYIELHAVDNAEGEILVASSKFSSFRQTK